VRGRSSKPLFIPLATLLASAIPFGFFST